MDEAVEDRIGERRAGDHVVPSIDRHLAGDEDRSGVDAILDDFEEIARLLDGDRFRPPIVEDEQLGAGERAHELAVTSVATGERERGEQARHPVVEDGQIVAAGFVAERAGKPTLADPARSSGILPGINRLRDASSIHSTLGTVASSR